MNRSMIAALLSMTMVILTGSWSYAVNAPHNFRCDQCHTPQGSNPTMEQRSHACIGCHSVSGTGGRMPFELSDMSNRFGSTPNAPQGGSQSSHNWKASAPYAPRANVIEATDNKLRVTQTNGLNLVGYVGCIKCHDVKLANGLNVTPGANKPLLRVQNTGDYLCANCHQPRQVTSAQYGSHPVAYRPYSTVYKSNTTAFRRTPKNANPANASSDLGRYLSNNQVVCSTCHGAHYADSSSATFGNRSTAAGFYNFTGAKAVANKFAKSAGNLLRTDYRGAAATDINTCSSCHKETAQMPHSNAKTKNQKMQCNDCHSAHVDYDAGADGPNWKLVRRYMNISTQYGAVRNGKAVFNGSTSMWYKKADGTGVCQSCHVVPEGPNDQQAHKVAGGRAANCSGCHNHTNGFTGDIRCTSCHGQPPILNSFGGPSGMPSGYTGDDSTSPHATHAAGGANYSYGCVECHYAGIGAEHNNSPKSFQSVFVDTTNSVGDKAGRRNISTDYNTTNQSCSSVYCHSNGAPRGGSIAWKTTPTWPGKKGSIVNQPNECTSCHEAGNTLNTNRHYRHVTDAGKACATCHSATVDASARIIDRAKHANSVKDVAIVSQALPGVVVNATYDSANATCTNSCHRNIARVNGFKVYTTPLITADWDDTRHGADYCGSCHAASPSTLAHPVHLVATSGPKLGSACTQCHPYTATGSGTTHANGTVSVISQTTACAPCHPSAASATWTLSTSVTCQSCHVDGQSIVPNPGFKSYSAPVKDKFTVSGHGQANSANGNYDVSRQCSACHSSNATDPHIGGGPTAKRLTLANDNTLCDSCHTTAAAKGLPVAKIDLLSHSGFKKYTSAASNVLLAAKCTACHDTHGTTNQFMIKTVINGLDVAPLTNISSGFIATTPGADGKYHGLCQVCHTRTEVYRNSPAKFSTYSGLGAGHDRKWCLECHKHKDPKATFAFQGVGGCNVCHGYPPAATEVGFKVQGNYSTARLEDNAGAGGAHTVQGHLPKTLTVANGSGYSSCVSCHNSVQTTHNGGGTPVKSQFVNVVVDTKYKFNKDLPINYNSLTGTCSNVSCHFQATPKWSPVKQ